MSAVMHRRVFPERQSSQHSPNSRPYREYEWVRRRSKARLRRVKESALVAVTAELHNNQTDENEKWRHSSMFAALRTRTPPTAGKNRLQRFARLDSRGRCEDNSNSRPGEFVLLRVARWPASRGRIA